MIEFYKRHFYSPAEILIGHEIAFLFYVISLIALGATVLAPALFSFWTWSVGINAYMARIALTALIGLLASSYKYGADK